MSQFSNPKKVMIPCRFSFLHCWEPDSVNGSEPKYSVSAIIPKSDTKTVNAIKAAIDEALKCKETGEEKTILFGLTGTGYFDMTAYDSFNSGKMEDYIPSDEELEKSFAKFPHIG